MPPTADWRTTVALLVDHQNALAATQRQMADSLADLTAAVIRTEAVVATIQKTVEETAKQSRETRESFPEIVPEIISQFEDKRELERLRKAEAERLSWRLQLTRKVGGIALDWIVKGGSIGLAWEVIRRLAGIH